MIILIIAFVMLVLGIVLAMMMYDKTIGVTIAAVGGVLLVIGLIALPINHYEVNAEIHSFEAVKDTADRARKRGDKLENVAMQLKIIEQNQWLASTKYYNSTVWGLWIPDIVDEIKPIK